MFIDRLLSAPDLVPLDAAAEKGLLRQALLLPSCGEVLDTHDAGRVHADHSVAVDGLRPIAVHTELPAYRCASCGHVCVEPLDTMINDLMLASAHANRSAHIAPG